MGTNGANFAWTPSVSMLSIERVAGDEVGCSKPQRESTDADGDLGETILGRLCLDLPDVFVGEVLRRLSACDRTMLAWTCGCVRRAVLASKLPRCGVVNHLTRERDVEPRDIVGFRTTAPSLLRGDDARKRAA